MNGLCMYEGLLDVKGVAEKLRRSVSYVWKKLEKDPNFPRPVWRRHKDTQWKEADIDAFILEEEDRRIKAEVLRLAAEEEKKRACKIAV